ncbi:hypothetical protein WG66_001282 [Moniliophthora roreri]|nr:hypothetical protein WG66_001282 [Moniliophthora roreri]
MGAHDARVGRARRISILGRLYSHMYVYVSCCCSDHDDLANANDLAANKSVLRLSSTSKSGGRSEHSLELGALAVASDGDVMERVTFLPNTSRSLYSEGFIQQERWNAAKRPMLWSDRVGP